MERAEYLASILEPMAQRVMIVGSLRRRIRKVGDIEILFIPRMEVRPTDLFGGAEPFDLTAQYLTNLREESVLSARPNIKGHVAWGPKNKLAIDTESGIPVDFFSVDADCWWNSVVMRTGGKVSNVKLCIEAGRLGWKFEPYGSGFSSRRGLPYHKTTSEEDVFKFVRLPCLPPHQRP